MDVNELPVFEAGQGGVDLTEFEGQKFDVEKVEIIDVKSDYTIEGEYSEGLQRDVKVLKVSTKPITTIKNKEGEEVKIRASELFNLKEQEGKWGISSHEKAKIQIFMKRQKVTEVKDLIGTKVLIRSYESKQGNTFLGFIIK